jgi:hypothetical protein
MAMFGRRWLAALWLAALLPACSPEADDTADVVRPEADVRVDAEDGRVEAEAEARECSSSAECDDGVACTQDSCVAGGTCSNQPLDALCDAGQRCVPPTGCTSAVCTRNEDCFDDDFCDGDEECAAGGCYEGPARDCNDGNVCTEDRCDDAEDRCVYEPVVLEGCDVDGGDAAAPFDPLVHYNGSFWLAPPQSQACGAVTYSIDTVTFTRSDAELRVSGPPCPGMVQAPPPAGADFAVSCTSGCATYALSGTFSNSNEFAGRWSATFSGCPTCSPQDVAVVGARR